MEQSVLFHEDIYDALRDCIKSLGGNKKVGSVFWPEKPIDKAGEQLADALNRNRAQKLDPEQVLWILKEARKLGCHIGMYYIADECDYRRPEPLEPRDEMAELQRDFIRAQKNMQAMLSRMEHFSSLKTF